MSLDNVVLVSYVRIYAPFFSVCQKADANHEPYLDEPGIDDIPNPIDRDGRFGDVGRHDHFPSHAFRALEDPHLALRGEAGVEGEWV